MENKYALPAAVAEKYDCTITPGPVILPAPYGRQFDLRTISLEDADYIHQSGVGYLVAKAPKGKRTTG